MPSAFSHPAVPLALTAILGKQTISSRLLFGACVASVFPDVDVVAFYFDIPYASPYGHRGFTHSLAFAAAIGGLGIRFHKELHCSPRVGFWLLFIATASHGLLDALTNGGHGIAFFWPFSDTRYFFPWQPIAVSPIGVRQFFSQWGMRVIQSELVWICLPALSFGLVGYLFRRTKS